MEKNEEKTVSVELTLQEVYQILMSLGYRISGVGQLIVNAASPEMEKAYGNMVNFLTTLSNKFQKILIENKEAESNGKQ